MADETEKVDVSKLSCEEATNKLTVDSALMQGQTNMGGLGFGGLNGAGMIPTILDDVKAVQAACPKSSPKL